MVGEWRASWDPAPSSPRGLLMALGRAKLAVTGLKSAASFFLREPAAKSIGNMDNECLLEYGILYTHNIL